MLEIIFMWALQKWSLKQRRACHGFIGAMSEAEKDVRQYETLYQTGHHQE
jgi:hypothetical protein